MSTTTIKKKELIFTEAAKLFQAKGYAATSMRELAGQVGLKPSSFYSHIKSKEEILEKICNHAALQFHQGLETVLEKYDSPEQQFEGIIDLHINIAFEDPSAITVFNDEWKHLSGEALKSFRAKRKSYQDAVISIIKQCIAEKSIRELDPMIIFNTFIGATRWLHFISAPSETMKQKISSQLKSLLLAGARF